VNAFVRLLGDDSGATLVEYAVVGATLAVAMIAALGAIVAQCGARLTSTSTNLTSLGVNPP